MTRREWGQAVTVGLLTALVWWLWTCVYQPIVERPVTRGPLIEVTR